MWSRTATCCISGSMFDTSIHAISGEAIRALAAGHPPAGIRLADSPVAEPEVFVLLADLASELERGFVPAAWLIVADGEAVGLCSVKAIDPPGGIDLGYGIAPTRQRRGHAGRAVAAMIEWARGDPRVTALTAETLAQPGASPRLLAANGFVRIGERDDPEDGPVWCWRLDLSS